jgi:uncharacterized protein YceK
MMSRNRRLVATILILAMLSTGCATLTTAAHFSSDSPLFYSGTRLDLHARAQDKNILRLYREKYGVEPPAYPNLDLPFSFLFDTLILIPVVLPIAIYQAVFD